MSIQYKISIEKTILLPIVKTELNRRSALYKLLDNYLSKRLELYVEVKLEFLERLSSGEYIFESTMHIRLDFF